MPLPAVRGMSSKFKNGGIRRGRRRLHYYTVLNVRKEVKIVFQREKKREIFYQSCKVHFIAFQANENELRAALQTHVYVILSPGQTSRSRKKESKVTKV